MTSSEPQAESQPTTSSAAESPEAVPPALPPDPVEEFANKGLDSFIKKSYDTPAREKREDGEQADQR
jgi:hypothetical protein